jgi:hypothetical protein
VFRISLAVLFSACVAAGALANPGPKRGVCAQKLSAEDFRALAPGVSWWYNWHFEPDAEVPEGGPEFVPMLWSDAKGIREGAERFLDGHPRPRALFVLNEPNFRPQANLSPEASAKAWLGARELADYCGVLLVGPHLAVGSSPQDSVTARNPRTGKKETFTWMVPYIDAFLAGLPAGASPVLAVHCYGNVGELKWAVGELAKRYGGPVWVTEFNENAAADEDAQIRYMKEAVEFLENSPDVAGYAWFMARIPGQPKYSLLADESGRLTRLGETYVNLPAGPSAGGSGPAR